MKTRVHRNYVHSLILLLGMMPALSCEKNVAGAAVLTLADVEIRVDWSLCRETPGAMTVLIYTEDGQLFRSKTTPETGGVHFQLPRGSYRSGVFSYSVAEWESLRIQGIDRWDTARAVPSATEPSVLACAGGSIFTISDLDIFCGHTARPTVLYPQESVHPLHIRILIDGLDHLGSISGSLSPSYSIYLFNNQTFHSIEEGLLLLPENEWVCDRETASIRRNIPGRPDRLESIQLRLTLRDGSIAADTTLDVRGRVTEVSEQEYLLSLGDRPGERFHLRSPGGGFEAEIGSWIPGEETEIILSSIIP